MSRRSLGARLYLEDEEVDASGKRQRYATWVIRDGVRKKRTGCLEEDREGADKALAAYIAEKYSIPRERNRHPSQILVLDALNLHLAEIVPTVSRPQQAGQRIDSLSDYFDFLRTEGGAKTATPFYLSDVNGKRCRDYVKWRTAQPRRSAKPEKTGNLARPITESMARRELEDLRSAINHHRNEGDCSDI